MWIILCHFAYLSDSPLFDWSITLAMLKQWFALNRGTDKDVGVWICKLSGFSYCVVSSDSRQYRDVEGQDAVGESYLSSSKSLVNNFWPLMSSSRLGMKCATKGSTGSLGAKSEVVVRKALDAPSPVKTPTNARTSLASTK